MDNRNQNEFFLPGSKGGGRRGDRGTGIDPVGYGTGRRESSGPGPSSGTSVTTSVSGVLPPADDANTSGRVISVRPTPPNVLDTYTSPTTQTPSYLRDGVGRGVGSDGPSRYTLYWVKYRRSRGDNGHIICRNAVRRYPLG